MTKTPKTISYCVDVTGTGDSATANLAEFTLDSKGASDILKLSAIAREMKLSRLERFDYSASFMREVPGTPEAVALGEENNVFVDCTSLVVTATDFYFRSYEKHSGIPISCAHQSLAELASHFGLGIQPTWHVVGAHENGNFFDIHAEAPDAFSAIGVAAKMLEEADEEGGAQFYAAILDGSVYELPGDGVVELSTVLDPEQKDVFSVPDSI